MPVRPRWYRAFFFLGRPPELTPRQWRVFGLVAAIGFFEQYDLYLFTLNLSQIQRELDIPESDLGFLGSIVRAGAVLALPIALLADRFGRRRLLLATVLGYTLTTGATAIAPDATTFVVLQFLARGFAIGETILATVVIVEEFPDAHRAWGIGAAGAIQASGAGAAAIAFGFVDVVPFGWRSLYAFGLGPLLLIAWWRRTLPETARFEQFAARRASTPGLLSATAGIVHLFARYPGRLLALMGVGFMLSMALSSAGFFVPKYLQDVHGWTPAGVATMNFFGGFIAILGNPLAGWAADRFGRRPVAVVSTIASAAAVIAFYSVGGPLLVALWVIFIFADFGASVAILAYSAELFPTAQRSTAASARVLASATGAVAGLATVSLLYGAFGNNWDALRLLACLCFVAAAIVRFALPETARRPLEQIAPEETDPARAA